MIGSSANGSGKTGKLRIGELPVAPSTVDKPSTARELEAKGIESDQAEAVVNATRQSSGKHIAAHRLDAHFSEFKAHFDAGLTRQRAGLYRALWLHGTIIVVVLAGLYTLAESG